MKSSTKDFEVGDIVKARSYGLFSFGKVKGRVIAVRDTVFGKRYLLERTLNWYWEPKLLYSEKVTMWRFWWRVRPRYKITL